jgi:hypothetical protein
MNALLRIAAPARPEAQGGPPPASMACFIALMMATLVIARHYSMRRRARTAGPGTKDAPTPINLLPAQDVDLLSRHEPTAVFLVGGKNQLGPITLRTFAEHHAQAYRQVLFLAVGVADASAVDAGHRDWEGFLRTAEAKRLKEFTRLALDPYVEIAHELGFKSDCRISIATDPAKEIGRLAGEVSGSYSRAMFFVGKIVFEHSRWYHRVLHSGTADSIRQFLEKRGIPVTVIPVVIDGKALNSAERN